MKILITGSVGFIGFHLSNFLLKKNYEVYGIDTINDYYDIKLKKKRLSILQKNKKFKFFKIDISKKRKIDDFFKKNKIDIIINLAAYAGVQYSLKNPQIYIDTNEIGFFNILENAKRYSIKKIIFASSSSVAGNNTDNYFRENSNTDNPISLYAATKKNNEILAHFYAVNYKLRIIGVRFFTVYGPYGRPDLSIFKFAHCIQNSRRFTLNNNGNHYRDFTYIDDVIKCLFRLIRLKKFHKIEDKRNSFFQIFNLGAGNKIKITSIVKILERLSKRKAKITKGPLKKGDIIFSRSSTKKLVRNIGYKPKTSISEGLEKFFYWFKNSQN